MEIQVVIVSCKNCIFTQNAETSVLESLDSINKGDIGNISLRVTSYDLRELCHNSVAVTVRKAKVQIVIVTHNFLDELKNAGKKNFCQVHLNRVLHSKGVICVLMRIDSQEILRSYSSLLPHFLDWNVLELRANKKLDLSFTKSFQEHVIQCYNNRAKHNQKILRFDTPFWTSVSGSSSGLYTSASSPEVFENNVKPLLLSTTSDEGRETITVKLNEPVSPSDELRIQLRKGDEIYSTFVQIPDNLSSRDSMQMQGSTVKIEAPFLLLSHIFPNYDDPIDQMLLKFPGYKQYLDDHLSQALEQVYAAGTSVERLTLLQEFLNGRDEILPTVLHFAAYYGLKESVVTQLEKGDGAKFIDFTNSNNETPLDLAQRRGHGNTVGQILKDYEGLITTLEAIQQSTRTTHKTSLCLTTNGDLAREPEQVCEAKVISDGAEGSASNREIDRPMSTSTYSNIDLEIEANPRSTIYINIEVVPPPELPERKPGGQVGDYCVPPSRPVSSKSQLGSNEYSVPPPHALPVVLVKKDGTIPRSDENYIHLYNKEQGQGDTLSRLNRNPIRASSISYNSTSDEDDLEPFTSSPAYDRPVPTLPSVQDEGDVNVANGYNRPVPLVPSVTEEYLKSKPEVKLDPVEEELVELIKKVMSKDTDRDQINDWITFWKENPLVKASEEQKGKDLEEWRAEYFEMQKNKNKGEAKEGGFLDRVVQKIRNAKKKISNSGLSGEDKMVEPQIISPPLSPQILHPNYSTMPNFPNRRRSSSLTLPKESVVTTTTTTMSEDKEKLRTKSESRRRLGASYISPLPFGIPGFQDSNNTLQDMSLSKSDGYLIITQGEPNENPTNASDIEPSMLESIMEGLKQREPEINSRDRDPTLSRSLTSEAKDRSSPPPPRPPKKSPFVKKCDPPSLVESKVQLENGGEANSEKRNFVPPKPTRRNIKTNTHYINYNDRDASGP